MTKKISLAIFLLFFYVFVGKSAYLLIPMDNSQTNHLKAYGIAYLSLQKKLDIRWLLNYRGGSFLIPFQKTIQEECTIRGVSSEVIADVQASNILREISRPEVNMDATKLEKAPRIAVYSPKNKLPWDDAVTLALTYAEIPYDVIYDGEILDGKLIDYDWLHLHHEDFTGQYGKFYKSYHLMPWYEEQVRENEGMATKYGFNKVSMLKLAVSKLIKSYVANGGFLFAMCSGTDSFDIALSAENTDICESMYDGDPADPEVQNKLDFSRTFAFKDFEIKRDPFEYEYSTIDATTTRRVAISDDFFSLFEFSAKWDPVPTMLCQNHKNLIKGFMGQTTSFNKEYIKSNVLIMGENKLLKEAKYIHGEYNKGTWTYYAGHDPEDYHHRVGDPPTNLDNYPDSPGYRLILNNIL
ncbi:asparagine synthetase B, partial [Bacteroidota bacterium]